MRKDDGIVEPGYLCTMAKTEKKGCEVTSAL